MGDIANAFDVAFRDFNTDGVPSSGPYKPIKSLIRAAADLVDQKVYQTVSITDFDPNVTGGDAVGFTAAMNLAVAYLNQYGGELLIPTPPNGLAWLLNPIVISNLPTKTNKAIIRGDGPATLIQPGSACTIWIDVQSSYFELRDMVLSDPTGLVTEAGIRLQKASLDGLPARFSGMKMGGFVTAIANDGFDNFGLIDSWMINNGTCYHSRYGAPDCFIENGYWQGHKTGVKLDATIGPVAQAEGFRIRGVTNLATQADGRGLIAYCAYVLSIDDCVFGQLGAGGSSIELDGTQSGKAIARVNVRGGQMEAGANGSIIKSRGNVSRVSLDNVNLSIGGAAHTIRAFDLDGTIKLSVKSCSVVGLDGIIGRFVACSGEFFDNDFAGGSKGLVDATITAAGSGGTNGTFAVGISGGGGTGATATFTVAGGALTAITITNPGKDYTSAPALAFTASAGLTGATATGVIDKLWENATCALRWDQSENQGLPTAARRVTCEYPRSWTLYTPTVTSVVNTITTLGAVAGRYKRDGTTTYLLLDIPITTNGTGAGAVTATLPLASAGAITSVISGRESDASGKALTGQITGSSVGIRFYDNTYPGADGARIRLNGYYETA